MSNNNKPQKLTDEKKYGSVSDIHQYNPNFDAFSDYMKRGGIDATGNINAFMSQIAPQIPGFFTNAQDPFMKPLTDRAADLGSRAGSEVANRYSGIGGAYSRAASEDVARAVAQPFANVQSQLGQQALGMGSQFMGQALGEYGATNRANLGARAQISGPQFINPYTYEGAKYADAKPGFWETTANIAQTATPFFFL